MALSETIIRSSSVRSRRSSSSSFAGSLRMAAERGMSRAANRSGSVNAVRNSLTLDGAMPANHSSPSASLGASPTSAAARVTRSGSSAAQARACGAPPERPATANRSSPRASATTETSSTTSATRRPALRSEPPYPGRS